jgi:hypothetical protein
MVDAPSSADEGASSEAAWRWSAQKNGVQGCSLAERLLGMLSQCQVSCEDHLSFKM